MRKAWAWERGHDGQQNMGDTVPGVGHPGEQVPVSQRCPTKGSRHTQV